MSWHGQSLIDLLSRSTSERFTIHRPSISLTPDMTCRQALCIEHTEGAHGGEAGALAAALLKAGQKTGSTEPPDESWPVAGADAAAMLSKMRSREPSLPAMKQETVVKLLR